MNLLDQEDCYSISLLKNFRACTFTVTDNCENFLTVKISQYTVNAGMFCHGNNIYRMATNFRGLKFSQISLDETFRDLIFEDRHTVLAPPTSN